MLIGKWLRLADNPPCLEKSRQKIPLKAFIPPFLEAIQNLDLLYNGTFDSRNSSKKKP